MDRRQASTVSVRFWGQPSHFPGAMQASSHRWNQRRRLWQRWWLSAVICEDCGGPTHPAVGSFAIFYHQTRRTLPRRGPTAGCTGDTFWTCRSASECWLHRLWPGQTGNCLTSLKSPHWEIELRLEHSWMTAISQVLRKPSALQRMWAFLIQKPQVT